MTSDALPFLYVDSDVPPGQTLTEFRRSTRTVPGPSPTGRAAGMLRDHIGRLRDPRPARRSPRAWHLRPRLAI